MQIKLMYDVRDLQLQLENIVYIIVTSNGWFYDINHRSKITIGDVVAWWIHDRLSELSLLPIRMDRVQPVPDVLKSILLREARPLETPLWHLVAWPYNGKTEWVHAHVDITRFDLIITLTGKKL